jgi:hypothetical protein
MLLNLLPFHPNFTVFPTSHRPPSLPPYINSVIPTSNLQIRVFYFPKFTFFYLLPIFTSLFFPSSTLFSQLLIFVLFYLFPLSASALLPSFTGFLCFPALLDFCASQLYWISVLPSATHPTVPASSFQLRFFKWWWSFACLHRVAVRCRISKHDIHLKEHRHENLKVIFLNDAIQWCCL